MVAPHKPSPPSVSAGVDVKAWAQVCVCVSVCVRACSQHEEKEKALKEQLSHLTALLPTLQVQ